MFSCKILSELHPLNSAITYNGMSYFLFCEPTQWIRYDIPPHFPSLRNTDVFPVLVSLPPKNNGGGGEEGEKKRDDLKYICVSQAEFFQKALGDWIPTTPAVISIQRLLTCRRWIRINLEHPIIYCYGRI